MIHQLKLFNFQEFVNQIRYKALKPGSEEKNLLPFLSKITEETELEDLHFYRDYMSKFDLEHDFEGLELSYDPIFEEYHSDILLLLRFVVASYSSTYNLDYNVYTDKATVTISAGKGDTSVGEHLDSLSTIQLYWLFFYYLKEQLKHEYVLEADDEGRDVVEEERSRALEIYREKIRSLKDTRKRKHLRHASKITIRDENGLGDNLIKQVYFQSQLDQAKHLIKEQFQQFSKRLFVEILGKSIPHTIFVDLVSDDDDESEDWPSLAVFNAKDSRENLLYFGVFKPVVVDVIENGKRSDSQDSIIHELIHACDMNTHIQNRKLLSSIDLSIVKIANSSDQEDLIGVWVVLHEILDVFIHLRNEGVALLGEHLLTKKQFGDVEDTIEIFSQIYWSTMMNSQKMIGGNMRPNAIFNEPIRALSYLIAPTIIVFVLQGRGDIGDLLGAKILDGLETGDYELTDSETNFVIKAALSLSLADFIQGVMMLGEEIAPAMPFLKFCALLQNKLEHGVPVTTSDMKTFSQLFKTGQKDPEKVYWKVMGKVTRNISPETEIDECYKAFCADKAKQTIHSHLMEKVDALYACFKNGENPKNKHIAQLALTYLFNQNDLIHDNLEGVGLVDDVTVIDHALKIIKSCI